MHIKTHLDVNLVALETVDHLTLMLDLTAPISTSLATRPGQGVQVVLDRSGSMGNGQLESAKESIIQLIGRLAPQDTFGLVAFNREAIVVAPTRTMSNHHLPSLLKAIQVIPAGGNTDISAGYLMGLLEIQQHPAPGGSTLILISDGQANEGEKDPIVLRNIAIKSTTNRVKTSTIGLGTGYDETILEAIAVGGGGSHRFANGVDESVGALAAEVDDLLDKSIVNTILRIKPMVGAQGAPTFEVLQRLPHWKDGDDYVMQLGDLYSGENRRFIIGVEIPKIEEMGTCKIADLQVDYVSFEDMAQVSVTIPVHINVVPGHLANDRVADVVVRAERLVIETQSEKGLAADEIRHGQASEGIKRLKNAAETLRRTAIATPLIDGYLDSMQILSTEIHEIERLALIAEQEDASFSAKRATESFSRGTRSRNHRNFPTPDQTEKEV